MHPLKRQLLASGDIRGLLALNRSIYGDMQMMARGYAASGDVLKQLGDGTDLNQVWAEFIETLAIANSKRSALVDLFCFRTTSKAETVLQSPTGTAEFEKASEYGVPQGNRAEQALLSMGFDFAWYDAASRMTWKYLADATASQVQALHNGALAADNRKVFKLVMERLFSNVNGISDGNTVFSLWNGTDGQTPPDFDGNSFSSGHNHFLTTGSTDLEPGDVEDLQGTVAHHGYGQGDGSNLVILCNPIDAERIATFRAGVNAAKFDFIPSADAPPYLTTETLVGSRPPAQFSGMKVLGQYGRALIVENTLMPLGYLVCLASGGSNSPDNPIGLREHPKVTGLQIIKGTAADYPLIDSYYVHGMGTGVRNRGAAAILQITTGAYTPPTF